MTKTKALEILQALPDDFQLEDFFERLLFVQRIEEGIRQADNGETLTEAEARTYLSRWTQSAGTAITR